MANAKHGNVGGRQDPLGGIGVVELLPAQLPHRPLHRAPLGAGRRNRIGCRVTQPAVLCQPLRATLSPWVGENPPRPQ
eukprot:11158320-Lingulodinium_polyedra.AAC.1